MTEQAKTTNEMPFDEETKQPPLSPVQVSEFLSLNIYQKINWVSSQVEPLKKMRSVKRANGSEDYSSTTFSQILALINPLMDRVGLALIPVESVVTRANRMTSGHYKYKLVNTDSPSEFEYVEIDSQGFDTVDKGANKASTAGMKYLLMRLFRLETEEDPDLISNDVYHNEGYPQKGQQPEAPSMMEQAQHQDPQYQQQQQWQQPQYQQQYEQQPQMQYQQQQQQQQQPIQQVDPQLQVATDQHALAINLFNQQMQKIESLNFNRDQMIAYLGSQTGGVDFNNPNNVNIEALNHVNVILQRTIETTEQGNQA